MADAVAASLQSRRGPVLSAFETWPAWLFYAPAGLFWFYFAARYGGLTLPTVTNTSRALSGYLGESKSEGLRLFGPKGRAHLPPFAVLLTGTAPEDSVRRAKRAMADAGLAYPVVGKPDIGQNGAGVMILHDDGDLLRWLKLFDAHMRIILQEYVSDEGEAGVFYVRRPCETEGRIVSLTLKYLPRVTGDGISTLRELILNDLRARHISHLYFGRHEQRLDDVVPRGEHIRLVSVGNHCRGAIFKNGWAHVTPSMEAAFNAIALEIPGFYFGRFDVRFRSLAELERGENFTILELNGGDAEMTHIWDAEETLLGAYRSLYRQYRTAFEIAAANQAKGAKPVRKRDFIAAWLDNRARLKNYLNAE